MTDGEFAAAAQPHAWLLAADSLHSQAKILRGSFGSSVLREIVGGRVVGSWDDANRGLFLLAGFCLENLLKGLLVYEYPQWIANGILARDLRTHSLTRLAGRSSLVPAPIRSRTVLQTFEQGLDSWARYPTALTKNGPSLQLTMNPVLWHAYEGVSYRFSQKLIRLLRKRWRGPHGIEGYFEISQGFHSFEVPSQSRP